MSRVSTISSLSVNDRFVAAGTTGGELWQWSHEGTELAGHTGLGTNHVMSVVLNEAGIQAAFCYPRTFCFDRGRVRGQRVIGNYSGHLVRRGEETLLCGWDRIRLFDRRAELREERVFGRGIEGVTSSVSETLILSGGIISAIPD